MKRSSRGTARSEELFRKARSVLPGGVNSPVRAFRAVGGDPLFILRARGPYLYDADENEYIDFVNSWGPMILGHAHPEVVEAVRAAVSSGTSFGAPTEVEVELAEMVVQAVPSLDMVRFVNSGTEATMSALRLARAFTKRNKIIKFAGCYHGHADLLLVQAGSGVTTLGLPDSPGVPKATVAATLVATYNDLDSVKQLYARFPGDIAGVIVEPVAGNMGVVLPEPDFLSGLREITNREDSLLIFDEVMTGFRVAYGGAQALFNIQPDLTCLGKVIGGGFPVGAYGGKREIMTQVAPLGPVYQAGTLSGNPVTMAAGLATLRILSGDGIYARLEQLSEQLAAGFSDAAASAGVNLRQTRCGSMLGLFFNDRHVTDFESAAASDGQRYARFFHAMLKRGCYFAPSHFEAVFVCTALTQDHLTRTLDAAHTTMGEIA